jgi:hypothetical protein
MELPQQQKATAFGWDVAPLGRQLGATGFARGAPHYRVGGLRGRRERSFSERVTDR